MASSTITRTYTGETLQQVQAAQDADALAAKSRGYRVVGERWDTTQPPPTMTVEYVTSPWHAHARWDPSLGASILVAMLAFVALLGLAAVLADLLAAAFADLLAAAGHGTFIQ